MATAVKPVIEAAPVPGIDELTLEIERMEKVKHLTELKWNVDNVGHKQKLEEKKRADELEMAEKKRADELEMAKKKLEMAEKKRADKLEMAEKKRADELEMAEKKRADELEMAKKDAEWHREFMKEKKIADESIRRDHNASMRELHASINNRPYCMTVNPELLMSSECQIVGTRAKPNLLVSEFRPEFLKLFSADAEPATTQEIVQKFDATVELLSEDTHVFTPTSQQTCMQTVSMSDCIVLMDEYVGAACGVDRTTLNLAGDEVFKHHGIRHDTNLVLSTEEAAMSVLRVQYEHEKRLDKVEARVDGVEERMDTLEMAALQTARVLSAMIESAPGAINPALASRMLCRLSDWKRQITAHGAALPDCQNRTGQEHKLLRTSRKTQPKIAQLWESGRTTMPCYSCSREVVQKQANVGHIVPSLKNTNGTHESHNLSVLCRDCNQDMGSTDADFWIDSQSDNSEC